MSTRPITVNDVMTADPMVISSHETIATAQATMDERGFRHLPVVDDGRLVGVLSKTDVGRLALHVPELMGKSIAELMTPNPMTIGPDERIEVAAANMALRKINCLMVVQHGELVGIVTTYDLLDALARRLREHT